MGDDKSPVLEYKTPKRCKHFLGVLRFFKAEIELQRGIWNCQLANVNAISLKNCDEVTFLIVGGGIAGVTCAETLTMCCPARNILLLTECHIIKIAKLESAARYLHKFDIMLDQQNANILWRQHAENTQQPGKHYNY
uniref:Uncharacterized protein n=1 Tax=Glossina pallidipes TaxID=7398 RepID=A0A1A9ZYG0_GLOPL